MAIGTLPPGPTFLIGILPHLFIPPTATYFLFHYTPLKEYNVSTLLQVLLCFISAPIFIAARITYLDYHYDREAKKLGAVQVPRVPGKWIGNVDLLIRMLRSWDEDYMGDYLEEVMKEHGHTINMRFLWDNFVFTTEPDHIKSILASDFTNFEKGDKFIVLMSSLLGTGVFNSDGDMWKFHRTMTRPFFHRERITDFEIFTRHADETIAKMKSILATGEPIEIQDMTGRFTLDSATEFLFGKSVRCIDAPLPRPFNSPARVPKSPLEKLEVTKDANNRFSDAMADAQIGVTLRTRLGPIWPLFEMFKDRTKDSMDFLNSYVEPILSDALEARKKEKECAIQDAESGKPKEDDTLLSYLVQLTDDKAIIQDALINILIAGRDTTTCTLTCVLYMLAMHPECLKRVREEVINALGSSSAPTYDDIREMKYLRAVINETLRLFPPVPFNIRQSVGAKVWNAPDGRKFYVPPHTSCPYSVWIMHRRKDLWGPDATEFDPDRWLDDRLKKHLTPNPFIFLPFNAGPRICLGQQFAYNELSFFLIRFFQSFDGITLAPEAQSPDTIPPTRWMHDSPTGRGPREKFWPKAHLTLYAHGGLWMRCRNASGGEAA